MNEISFTWQQNIFVGEGLNWHERNLTLDDFKNIWFLGQDVDGGNAFVSEQRNYSDQIS